MIKTNENPTVKKYFKDENLAWQDVYKAKEKNISSVFILTTQTADWFESLGFKSDSIETMPEERRSRWSAKRGSKLFRKSLC